MEWEGKVRTCQECFEEYVTGPVRAVDGFCSDECKDAYDVGLTGITVKEERS